MIPAGYVECTVLKGERKFYDELRYFVPKMGEVIILPEYIAYLESKAGNVDILEDDEDDEDDEDE